MFVQLWDAAALAFGKEAGGSKSLTPFSRTWHSILERYEHALWHWNDAYGPLTVEQREYAVQLFTSAIEHAAKAPSYGLRYAYFFSGITSLMNHETVQAGMRRRGAQAELAVELDLGRIGDGA